MVTTLQPQFRGFTLLEAMLSCALIAILAAIAIPMYQSYRYRLQVQQAISDIGSMSGSIGQYILDNRTPPPNLTALNLDDKLDPWGQPYRYLNLDIPGNRGAARKDRRLNPLNSDFDLYSIGKDGQTRAQLVPRVSHDDVLRASDGAFIGLGKDF